MKPMNWCTLHVNFVPYYTVEESCAIVLQKQRNLFSQTRKFRLVNVTKTNPLNIDLE